MILYTTREKKIINHLQPLRVGVPALLPCSSTVVSALPTDPDEPLLCSLGVPLSKLAFSALCGLLVGIGDPLRYILPVAWGGESDLETVVV